LHWPDGTTPDYAPAKLGDLYAGEPIVVTARMQGPVRGMLAISGSTTGRWARQLSLDGRATREGIAALWARYRVGDLMDLRASNVDENTIRSQVLPLALQYGLVTRYTSLIAVDRTPVRPVDAALDLHRIANTKPQGSNWPTPELPKTATPAELQMMIGAGLLMLAFVLWRRKVVRA
jgi:Ca-activated chloride channel family protein